MRVGRKDALIALVLGFVPFLARRALAQTPVPAQVPAPVNPQTIINDLQRRIAALETQLANQVAFSKDGSGNLTLNAAGNVTLSSGGSLALKGTAQTSLSANAAVRITGAIINLN